MCVCMCVGVGVLVCVCVVWEFCCTVRLFFTVDIVLNAVVLASLCIGDWPDEEASDLQCFLCTVLVSGSPGSTGGA